ncbi:helix-turn-helix domain-containing protein [Candidatus Enterococcus clewellii]|uniref:HTH araC/xylS-type domain-containing protein n=1 Tax=Candidatus Enterococcus clewellii TaxID=1834193 RepID=A0AAQ3VX54_9ENTE
MSEPQYIVEHFSNRVFCSYAKTKFLSNEMFHMHNYYEMNLFLKGDMTFFIDDIKIQPVRGTLFLIDSTQVHGPKLLSQNEYERAIVHFDPKLALHLSVSQTDLLHCFSNFDGRTSKYVILDEKEIALFSELTKEIEKMGQASTFFGKEVLVNAYLAQLLVVANRHADEGIQLDNSVEHSEMIRNILTYINSHIKEKLSLRKIEKEFLMNKHYLNRLFKKELGISIYQFIILKKVSLAKQLLAQGYSPKQVYIMLDYQDYSTFSRAFKKVTDTSPTTYTKSIL